MKRAYISFKKPKDNFTIIQTYLIERIGFTFLQKVLIKYESFRILFIHMVDFMTLMDKGISLRYFLIHTNFHVLFHIV